MDIINLLRESNSRLLKLERALDIERDNVINHPSNDNVSLMASNNATYFPYLSCIDKYTGFANDYNVELSVFKDLLQKSLMINQNNNNSQSSLAVNNNNEITSNYLPTNIVLSPPLVDNISNAEEPYSNDDEVDDASNSSSNSRQIATSNNSVDEKEKEDEKEEEIPESNEVTVELPNVQPLPVRNSYNNNNNKKRKMVAAKVSNALSYKYEGRGFDIWKKNGQRAIYNKTELYCSRIFGDDDAGKAKLKRFLIKRGGFKAKCIENIKIEAFGGNKGENKRITKYGLITVRDSVENIENGLNKMNENKKESIIWEISQNNNYRNMRQNKKLFIKNFDILSGSDHRKLTDLFLKFGDLETDIFINRDRNNTLYGFVQFRDINDAISCEKNQNFHRYWTQNEPIWFNGRELHIEYVRNDNKSNNNNNNKKKRTYYNTRR